MKKTIARRNRLGIALVSLIAAGCMGGGADEQAVDEQAVDEYSAAIDESVAAAALPRVGAFARTTASVALRSGPDAASPSLQVLPANAKVFVHTGPHNTTWFEVGFNGVRGFVDGGFLAPGRAAVVRKLPTTAQIAALTFDAGSDRGFAGQILDTLAAEGVPGSFGITGRWAEANPDLVRRMADEGHMIFNHTYSHRSFTGFSTGAAPLTYDERAVELWKTHKPILDIAGVSSKPFFRPPFGDQDTGVLEDVWSRGYDFSLMWSCDSLGWRGLSADEIVARVISFLEPGAIYLFHVGSSSQDGPALSDIIAELRGRGYRFERVSTFFD